MLYLEIALFSSVWLQTNSAGSLLNREFQMIRVFHRIDCFITNVTENYHRQFPPGETIDYLPMLWKLLPNIDWRLAVILRRPHKAMGDKWIPKDLCLMV